MAKSKSSKQTASSNDKNSLVIYRRILRLDQLFSAETYPSLKELLEDDEVDASRTTIFRTIEFMRDQLHAPIVHDKIHGGYCYSEKTFRLPSVFTSEQELFALTLMQDMTEKFKGTPLYDSANSILNFMRKNTVRNPKDKKFSTDSSSIEDSETDWMQTRYVFLNKTTYSIDDNTWNVLHNAMKINRQVEFEYRKEEDIKWKHITISPYQVVNSDGRWYVWGIAVNAKSEKLYALDLIRNMKIFPRAFTLPKNFDLRTRTTGAFGAYVGPETYFFKAKFYGWAASYVRRIKWGDDQEIDELENGGIGLSFIGTELLPFLNLILSFGKNAIPLAPKELVDMWKDEISYNATTNTEKVNQNTARWCRGRVVITARILERKYKDMPVEQIAKEDWEEEVGLALQYEAFGEAEFKKATSVMAERERESLKPYLNTLKEKLKSGEMTKEAADEYKKEMLITVNGLAKLDELLNGKKTKKK